MLRLRLYAQCSYLLKEVWKTSLEAHFPETVAQDKCHRTGLIRKTVAPELDAKKLTTATATAASIDATTLLRT